jgi:hypothetical protein
MKPTYAMCGLDCSICPAFIARKTNDQALREKTAVQWSKDYHVEFKPKMVNCDGCTAIGGVHIGHCAECEIRICALAKGVRNCALCAEYPCPTISAFIAKVPPAKENLEKIRSKRKS